MKKLLLPICFAVTLAACSDKKENEQETTRQIVLTDTANLNTSNASTDIALNEAAIEAAPKPQVVYVDRYISAEPTPRPRKVTRKAPVEVEEAPQENTGVNNTPTTGSNTPAIPDVVTTAPEPAVKEKKGISDAAKGAVIGGVGGAVAGAVIGRNGKGAAVGAVIGAAGGYIIGRKKDKQSGRIE